MSKQTQVKLVIKTGSHNDYLNKMTHLQCEPGEVEKPDSHEKASACMDVKRMWQT